VILDVHGSIHDDAGNNLWSHLRVNGDSIITDVISVSLDGKPLEVSFLRHKQITAGGELMFRKQAVPNKA